ncbi:hypothetical protein HDV00_008888, partial [Rhizophlyctis rosea]
TSKTPITGTLPITLITTYQLPADSLRLEALPEKILKSFADYLSHYDIFPFYFASKTVAAAIHPFQMHRAYAKQNVRGRFFKEMAIIGQCDAIDYLLEQGVKPTFGHSEALYQAILHGARSTDVIRTLLSAGADQNARDRNGVHVLVRAVNRGWWEALTIFRDYGVDINIDGGAVIRVAEEYGDPKILQIIAHWDDWSQADEMGGDDVHGEGREGREEGGRG